jgi:hypothetical protein
MTSRFGYLLFHFQIRMDKLANLDRTNDI